MLGKRNISTWMVVVSIVVMAMTVHPSLLAYLLVGANGGWMILTREIARTEGRSHEPCWVCIIAGACVLLAAMVVMLKVNWLAI